MGLWLLHALWFSVIYVWEILELVKLLRLSYSKHSLKLGGEAQALEVRMLCGARPILTSQLLDLSYSELIVSGHKKLQKEMPKAFITIYCNIMEQFGDLSANVILWKEILVGLTQSLEDCEMQNM